MYRAGTQQKGTTMGLCKDPSLTFLNGFGYNVIRLPRAGIEPLDLLARDGSLEKIGTLPEFLDSPRPIPTPTNQTVAGLDGKVTDKLDAAIGIKILSNILAGMASAAGLPSLKTSFQRARSIQFRFENTQARTINPSRIGEYLAEAHLRENPFNDRYLLNEDTEEYVIFEVLQSDSVTVLPRAEKGVGVSLDIPAIQGAVGANVEVKQTTTQESAISFKGRELLTFGFKCFRLEFAGGKWRVLGAAPSGNLAFAVAPDSEDPVVFAPGQRIPLRF